MQYYVFFIVLVVLVVAAVAVFVRCFLFTGQFLFLQEN